MRSYHSANLLPVHDIVPVDRWEGEDGSVAFVHDLLSGDVNVLPSEYDRCDVLYADLPWRSGFETFNDRAGIHDGRTYPEFMAAVSRAVIAANRPTVLLTGKHALRYLPEPAQTLPARMMGTGEAALAVFYNLVTGKTWAPSYGVPLQLARTYTCVGDFCCGYGNVLRAFAQEGKQFVGSDYNPACIGYVAEHAITWQASHA